MTDRIVSMSLEDLLRGARRQPPEPKPPLSKEVRARAIKDAFEEWTKPNPFKVGDLIEPKPKSLFPGPGHWRDVALGVVVETFPPRWTNDEAPQGRADMTILLYSPDGSEWVEMVGQSRYFRIYEGEIA